MNKKKITLYIIIGFVIVIALILIFALLNTDSNKLVNLSYEEIIQKVDNKEDFILCVSRVDCPHCIEYKPKLSRVSVKYKITIYYTDIDTFSEEDYQEFRTRFSFDGSTPTTIFFRNGEEKTTATRIDGNVSFDKIVNKLKSNGFIK